MKAVIQRVKSSSVVVSGKISGEIGEGLLILLGVMGDDSEYDAEILAKKTANLRVFRDENNKMNKSLLDINGEALVVSQFTLCADLKKGNRPSFSFSAEPDKAKKLYEYYIELLRQNGVKKVEQGVFGGDMEVNILNNGPVTILYDTEIYRKNES